MGLPRRLIHLDGPSGRACHLDLEEVLPAKSEQLRIWVRDVEVRICWVSFFVASIFMYIVL